jgi:spheroidene monooxygenase
MAQCVTLSLFRFASPLARVWVLGQMALARLDFAAMPEAEFAKLCGSGTGEGFTPRPNTAVWAILAGWPDLETARRQIGGAAVYRRWRARAAADWTLFLEPLSARGKWAGAEPFRPIAAGLGDDPRHGAPKADPVAAPIAAPIAALTRATVRPSRALRFWGRVPDISAVIGSDPNVLFKIGIGEVPLLHQVTFSVWPDQASMAAFARGGGPHGQAIRAVREGNWFAEELYARFRLIGETGRWGGQPPLAPPLPEAA